MKKIWDKAELLAIEYLKALKKLTKSDLEIIELKYRFGLSINEIAIKLSLNNESAKKRHQRAIAKLRKDLK